MSRIVLSRLLLVGALMAASAPASGRDATAAEPLAGVEVIDAAGVIALATSNEPPKIVDVRLPGDVETGRIQGSVNLLDTEMTKETLAAIAGPDEPVIFYCNGEACPRSGNACAKAVGWGWSRVYWFRGGISEWVANELPLVVD